MNPLLRNILAVIAAIFIGSIVNMGIVILGPSLFGIPEGVNPEDINSIKEHADLYTFKHFLSPLLAHALGTLVGAYTVSRVAASNYKNLALLIGGIFLLGGIMMAVALPEFLKFSIVDLLLAYIPMAYLGWKLAGSPTSSKT